MSNFIVHCRFFNSKQDIVVTITVFYFPNLEFRRETIIDVIWISFYLKKAHLLLNYDEYQYKGSCIETVRKVSGYTFGECEKNIKVVSNTDGKFLHTDFKTMSKRLQGICVGNIKQSLPCNYVIIMQQ